MWADGYRYTGAFIDGLKTGYGEYYYKNGDNYKGMFQVEDDNNDTDDDDDSMMIRCFRLASSTGRASTAGPTAPSTWASTTR